MVKYLSFHNSSFALGLPFFNVNWQGHNVTHHLLNISLGQCYGARKKPATPSACHAGWMDDM
jgi:hypothetical protein